MLPVMQRLTLVGLASLEQQRVAARADRQGLSTRHAVEVEGTAANLPHCHQQPPVNAPELVSPTRLALVVVLKEAVSMQHHHPASAPDVPGPHRRRIRQ